MKLLNTTRLNEILADSAQIEASCNILEVGFDFGERAIFFAERYGCHVTGFSLDESKVKLARELAKERNQYSHVSFQVRDIRQAQVAPEYFDIVMVAGHLEKIDDKVQFIRDLYPSIKPGGKLVIADFFTKKTELTDSQLSDISKWYPEFKQECSLLNSSLENDLKEGGFENISFKDITKEVFSFNTVFSDHPHLLTQPALWLNIIMGWLGLCDHCQVENAKSIYYQEKTFAQGVWQFGLFVAKKR